MLWFASSESVKIKNLLEEELCEMKSRDKNIADSSACKMIVKWNKQ